jgi:SAM-dependent methyltransferase
MTDIIFENFDQFSINGRSIYISGWARDVDPQLLYDGVELPILTERVKRPDVAVVFDDPQAADWGFVSTALLPTDRIDRAKLAFGFRRGEAMIDAVRDHAPHEDARFQDMQDRFIDTVKQTRGSLLEIGSRARSGNSYRNWFPNDIDYVGLDVSAGPNVNIVGDAHAMPLDRQFDFIFSVSVFEHLLMPWKVALEMNRFLKKGGMAFIASHASFPLHDQPWDFWRFSKEAWGGLFNVQTGFEVLDAQYRYPASVVPRYVSGAGFEGLYAAPAYLSSACLIRKTGVAMVEWNARTADVYDMRYSHDILTD